MADAAPVAPVAPAPSPAGTAEPKAAAAPADPGAKTVETPAQAAARKKKYVVDGREVELDLSDEKKVDMLIQKGLGADKRFDEMGRQRKEAEMLLSLLQKNPMAVLERVTKMGGLDARKVVEDWLWENHVEMEQLTPEQREAEINKKKLADFEEKDKERLTREQAEQFEKAKEHYRGVFERDIITALETSGLPKTAFTVGRFAHYMSQALKAKVKVSAADIAPLVKTDFDNGYREMFGAASGDMLAKLVGEDGLKKLRIWEMERLKSQGAQPVGGGDKKPEEPRAPEPKGGERTLSKEEWRENLRKRTG